MAQFAKRRLVCDYEIPCSCSLSRLATCFDLFSFLMSMNVTVFMCQFLAFFKERPKAEKQVSKLVPRSIETKHFSGTKIKLKRKKSTQKLDLTLNIVRPFQNAPWIIAPCGWKCIQTKMSTIVYILTSAVLLK